MQTEFTTFDVVRILDIDRERLREWMKRGYIKPSIRASTGQGTKALFSRFDLYRIAFFKKLLMAGVPRDRAAQFLVYLSDEQQSGILGPMPQFFCIFREARKDADGVEYLAIQGIHFGGSARTKSILYPLVDDSLDDALVINIHKLVKSVSERL